MKLFEFSGTEIDWVAADNETQAREALRIHYGITEEDIDGSYEEITEIDPSELVLDGAQCGPAGKCASPALRATGDIRAASLAGVALRLPPTLRRGCGRERTTRYRVARPALGFTYPASLILSTDVETSRSDPNHRIMTVHRDSESTRLMTACWSSCRPTDTTARAPGRRVPGPAASASPRYAASRSISSAGIAAGMAPALSTS